MCTHISRCVFNEATAGVSGVVLRISKQWNEGFFCIAKDKSDFIYNINVVMFNEFSLINKNNVVICLLLCLFL